MESIQDSVYQEFIADINRRGLHSHFNILKTHIECLHNSGVIKFSGIKSNSKRLDSQKLKGFSDFDAAWLEEADAVSKESWDALIPTMRKAGSEIWVSYNPKSILDETHKRFVINRTYPDYKDGKRYCIVKKINYTDNPRFPQELRDDMELMKSTDYDSYKHIYLGEPVADTELSIIKPDIFDYAIDAHNKLGISISGGIVGGFDISDDGPDCNALAWRNGILLSGLHEWRDKDPASATDHAYSLATEHRISTLVYDSIGVGAGAKGQFRQIEERLVKDGRRGFNRVTAEPFEASGSVVNPDDYYAQGKRNRDMFLNIKAQAWWTLADRFKNTRNAVMGRAYDPEKIISIIPTLPFLDKLKAELCQPRREYLNGKIKVESKDSMKKRGIASPNLADAVVMAYASDTVQGFDISALL
jgi:phage terminase large subunit